jgi:argininosuccinate lyase
MVSRTMSNSFPHPEYSQHVLLPAYRDAQAYLFEPMLAANEAHASMLAKCGIISEENAAAILSAVAEIRAVGAERLTYEPGVEDLFFRVESFIMERAGPDFGGNLQLARSRNDLGQALERMALRARVLDLYEQLLALREVVHRLAQRHLQTLMPGYTHTQPAQPVTFAHYLAGVLTFLAADQQRFQRAYTQVNQSPLGAAAFTGTGFPVDRHYLAEALGFDGVIENTHHCIGAGDHLTETAFAVQSLAIGLSRVTRDLLFLATQEANAIRIDDSFIQISSIMPQKRNPVVLEHLRARLSRTIGFAHAVAIQCHNIPYGDTQDIEDEILPPMYGALNTVSDCIDLYAAVFDTLELNEEYLANRAGEGFTTATELADTLVRSAGLPFRLAHKVVSTMVQAAVAESIPNHQLSLAMLQAAARKILGQELPLTEAQFNEAMDARHFIEARNGIGGVAPEATQKVLTNLAEQSTRDLTWLTDARKRLNDAEELRRSLVTALLEKIGG